MRLVFCYLVHRRQASIFALKKQSIDRVSWSVQIVVVDSKSLKAWPREETRSFALGRHYIAGRLNGVLSISQISMRMLQELV